MIDHSKTKRQLVKEFFSEIKKFKVFSKNLYYIKISNNEMCHDVIIWLSPDDRMFQPLWTENFYFKKKLFGFINDKELFIERLQFKMLPSMYFKYLIQNKCYKLNTAYMLLNKSRGLK